MANLLPTDKEERGVKAINKPVRRNMILQWLLFQVFVAGLGFFSAYILGAMLSNLFYPHQFTVESPFNERDPLARTKNRKLVQSAMLQQLRDYVSANSVELYATQETEIQTYVSPTPETFMKECVLKRRPCLFNKVVDDWKAYREWNDEYFNRKIGSNNVNIEVTKGQRFYGDAGRRNIVKMKVRDFLKEVRDPHRKRNLYLAETSIHEFFPELLSDFPEKYPSMVPKLLQHDVTQLWVGAGGQVTPIHNDEAENVLCQFRGARRFRVFDPSQVDLLYLSHENPVYPQVSLKKYAFTQYYRFPLYRKAKELDIVIRAGQCMYLPATWYHEVESQDGDSLAINYWYTPVSDIESLIWRASSSFEWRDPTNPNAPLLPNRKSGNVEQEFEEEEDPNEEK